MDVLDIVIGIVVFFLLLSLVSTAIAESISTWLRWRGRTLRMAVQAFLNGSHSIVSAIYSHPQVAMHSPPPQGSSRGTKKGVVGLLAGKAHDLWLRLGQLFGRTKTTAALPSYLPQADVARATLDVVLGMPADECGCLLDAFTPERRMYGAGIASAATGDLANDLDAAYQVLRPHVVAARGDLNATIAGIAGAFSDVTQRSTGWFKRRMSKLLLAIGFVLAFVSNGDALRVAGRLTVDPTMRKLAVELAPSVLAIQYQYSSDTATADSLAVASAARRDPMDSIMVMSQAAGTLAGGWKGDPILSDGHDRSWWEFLWQLILKGLGFAITAAAVSLGAPFWFDVLSKLANIRSAVKPAPPKTEADTSVKPERSMSEITISMAEHSLNVRGGITSYDLDLTALLSDAAMAAYSTEAEAVRKLKAMGHDVADAKLIDVLSTDTQALVLRYDERIIVAYRGTEGKLRDILTDVNVQQQEFAKLYGAQVHHGFDTASSSAWSKVKETVWSLAQGHPTATVHFCGHSLGGALAHIAALRYVEDTKQGNMLASVATFGQPRVGNRAFAEMSDALLAGRYTRAMHHRDIVPRVPFTIGMMQYAHSGRLHYFDSNGRLWVDPSWVARLADYVGHAEEVKDMLKDKFTDHSAETYALLYRNVRGTVI
jgi:hypothetical protein